MYVWVRLFVDLLVFRCLDIQILFEIFVMFYNWEIHFICATLPAPKMIAIKSSKKTLPLFCIRQKRNTKTGNGPSKNPLQLQIHMACFLVGIQNALHSLWVVDIRVCLTSFLHQWISFHGCRYYHTCQAEISVRVNNR